jgi:hypothetical protein
VGFSDDLRCIHRGFIGMNRDSWDIDIRIMRIENGGSNPSIYGDAFIGDSMGFFSNNDDFMGYSWKCHHVWM